MVYIRDVANVHDGNAPQTNIVHVNGNRSVLMSVLKNGTTSTLAIVDGVLEKLKAIKPSLPEALTVKPINDQSLFVRAAIQGVGVRNYGQPAQWGRRFINRYLDWARLTVPQLMSGFWIHGNRRRSTISPPTR